ncbi:unnamed protein product [Strongylus vulgaris]|uniref:TRAF3-interacting protein 1 N-terminal domain-containing protein n=1 Tax=Strongylus vulgaris TaxID=40348 RepID=A0A3P7INS4_STRVU|nr:unnamed protein product [Strongylus vulgaris]
MVKYINVESACCSIVVDDNMFGIFGTMICYTLWVAHHMVNAEETRVAFSGLIEKPPLTDQLLARPPFKFILDVVSSTISKTGYLKDKFTSDDLNPAKLNDKAAKMAFLDSLIQALNDGSLDEVKSSKIVAGKEPELTNLMLIRLAEGAREYRKSRKSSKKSHHDEDAEKTSKSKHRSKSKEPKEEKTKSRSSSKHREEKERDERKEEKKEKKSSKDKEGHHKSSKKRTDDEKKKKKEKKEKEERHIEEEDKEQKEQIDRDINSNVVEAQADQGFDEPSSSHVDSPKTTGNALSPAKTDDSGVGDMTESPRPPVLERPMTAALARPQTSMGRPGTAAARPAPPKLKRKQIATVEETSTAPVQTAAEVITEAEPPAPEETFLVEEEEVEEVVPNTFKVTEAELPNDERGGLVQKMIDTTAGFDDGGQEIGADVDQGEFAREKLKAYAIIFESHALHNSEFLGGCTTKFFTNGDKDNTSII